MVAVERFGNPRLNEERRPLLSAQIALVHLALAMGGFAIGTTEFAAMSLLPYFAHDLRITEPAAGHVISAYACGVVVGAPVIALLAAKWSRRVLLIWLMTIFAAANVLTALAPSYGWMLTFRFLSGIPHGAYFGVATLVATSLVVAAANRLQAARIEKGTVHEFAISSIDICRPGRCYSGDGANEHRTVRTASDARARYHRHRSGEPCQSRGHRQAEPEEQERCNGAAEGSQRKQQRRKRNIWSVQSDTQPRHRSRPAVKA